VWVPGPSEKAIRPTPEISAWPAEQHEDVYFQTGDTLLFPVPVAVQTERVSDKKKHL
jgi:hypothetical protein